METKKKDEEESKPLWLILTAIGIFILVLGGWRFYWYWIESNYSGHEARGLFGDMFGALNALFTGLAFGGLIVTILLQSQELKLQRRELKETRKEFNQQNQTLSLQRFENTFFNLLRLHSEILDSLKINIKKTKNHVLENETNFKGREFFNIIYDKLFKPRLNIEFKGDNLELLEYRYVELFELIKEPLTTYLRSFHRLFRYVAHSDLISQKQRTQYLGFIEGNLSPDESTCIFYHVALHRGDIEAINIREIEHSIGFFLFVPLNHVHPSHGNLLLKTQTYPFSDIKFNKDIKK